MSRESIAYARSIAYLRCPHKVRQHTKRAYGSAPSLDACAAIVDAHTAPQRRFNTSIERRGYCA